MADALVRVIDERITVSVQGTDLIAPLVAAAASARDDILNDAGFQAVSADLLGDNNIGAVGANIADVEAVADDLALGPDASFILRAPGAAADSLAASGVSTAGATSSSASATLALAANNILGPETTYAALISHLGSYSVGNQIRVLADENYGNQMSIYTKTSVSPFVSLTSGGLVSTQYDHLGRTRVPPRLMGDRGQGPTVYKAFADLVAGTLIDWREMDFGDSLHGTVALAAQPYIAGFMSTEDIYAYGSAIPGTKAASSATIASYIYYTGTLNLKTTSEYVWSTTGTTMDLTSGQYAIAGGGVNQIISNTQYAEICLQPGGGIVKLWVSGNSTTPTAADGSWRNPTSGEIHSESDVTLTGSEMLIDTSGTAGNSVIVKLQLALGNWSLKFTHVSGGQAKIMGEHMMAVHGVAAINTFRIAAASNDSANTNVLSVSATAKKIAKFKPHLIRIGNDDRIGGIQKLLPHIVAAIAAAGLSYLPVIEVAVMPYYSNPPNFNDYSIGEAGDWANDYRSNRPGIVVTDLLAIGGGYTLMNNAGWASDPIHPLVTVVRELLRPIYAQRGWLPLRLRVPGGDATGAQILTAAGPTGSTSKRLLNVTEAPVLLGAAPIDTAAATWTGFTPTPLPTGASITQNAARQIVGATGAVSGAKIWTYVDIADDVPWKTLYTSPSTRSGMLRTVLSFMLLIKQGGASDILRFMLAADRNYNAVHTGAVTQGIGWKVTGAGTLNAIGGLSGSETASTDSYAVSTGFLTAKQVRITLDWRPGFKPDGTTSPTTGTLYLWANGTPLAGVEATASNWKTLRFEAEQASGTDFKFVVSPPTIHTFS